MHKEASVKNIESRGNVHHHRRARTLLDTIGNVEEDKKGESDAFGLSEGDNFSDFDKIFQEDPSSHNGDFPEEPVEGPGTEVLGEVSGVDGEVPHEGLPLLGGDGSDSNKNSFAERQRRARQLLMKREWKKYRELLNPLRLIASFFHWLVHSSLMVAIPLFLIAWILFYYCGNPAPPEFFPGTATLSW
jgi:hypothetical protein